MGFIVVVAGGHDPALHAGEAGAIELVAVGLTTRAEAPAEDEVRAMVDEVIEQVPGPQGHKAMIKPGGFCYDCDADGILDGDFYRRLVDADAIGREDLFHTTRVEPSLGWWMYTCPGVTQALSF